MLECFKSKSGGSVYYFDGKRISKKDAQNIASSSGKKLPSCAVKSAKNELKSLKRRIKDVMSGRETYKTTSKDLEERLNACGIIRDKYENLISLIDSASDSVNVMNRVCLTQDVKRKMDEEYSLIERNLQNSTIKNQELEGIVENDKSLINDLTNMLYQMKQLNLNLESVVEKERKGKLIIEKTLNDLTEQCSDRPDLLRTVDTLREQVARLQESNDDVKNDLQTTIEMNDNMKKAVSSLKTKLKVYKEEAKKVYELTNLIDQYKVAVERYDMETETLDRENKELRDSIVGNADLQTILDQLRNELNQKSNDEEELRQELIKARDDYGKAVNKYADDMYEEGKYVEELEIANKNLENRIQSMADLSKKLNYTLRQEKDRCMSEVQQAISEEREISKKETKEFESKIADLNSKLLITEETLEELNKVGKLKSVDEIEEVKNKMKKVSKKLKKASK
jgi:DNA repair exonuclease SbcCD ATPase subunit